MKQILIPAAALLTLSAPLAEAGPRLPSPKSGYVLEQKCPPPPLFCLPPILRPGPFVHGTAKR